MKPKSNMYKLSVKQFNPYVGCKFGCPYCIPSFQRNLKRWAKAKCIDCYNYKPHMHPERLTQRMPRTGYMQFIFVCSSGDVAFCPTPYLVTILKKIEHWSDRTFLLQSKDPYTFKRVEEYLPRNLIIGTTIETNLEVPWKKLNCKAPPPDQRWRDLMAINHEQKMVAVEPVLDFRQRIMVEWMEQLKPVMIWLGYDSKNCKLPEPSLWKTKQLHYALASRGFTVNLKTMRKAWWEK